MPRFRASSFRRAGVAEPVPPRRFVERWYGRALLLLLSAGLLTLAFAPVGQWYLAYVGLAPWLLVLHSTRSQLSAFFWSWVGGLFFFSANMWWMASVTAPGMVGLMAILGLYWAYAGLILRGAGIVDGTTPPSSVRRLFTPFLIAAVWVAAAEWFRGNWPWHGLPWLQLGHTQTTALPMAQVADLVGIAGVSFVAAAVNGWVAMWAVNRFRFVEVGLPAAAVVALVAGSFGYGEYRMHAETLTPGPRVLVVQPNVPQDNSGAKGWVPQQWVDFHLSATRDALTADDAVVGTRPVDLVVWSETVMPALNAAARAYLRGTDYGVVAAAAATGISNLAFDFRTGVITGGAYWDRFTPVEGFARPADNRNSAYFFNRSGVRDEQRYDKIHLVPFGEFIPFKESFPALYRLMVRLGPPDMETYQLTPGDDDALPVFKLSKSADGESGGPAWTFVTPICFEDIDPVLCARMVRPDPGSDIKRADMLINMTNDGWFMANENAQHMQAAAFRSIENRVPIARSVNTGISGFVDPLGRMNNLLPTRTSGTSVAVMMTDPRVTLFTRWGNWFALCCVGITLLTAFAALGAWGVRKIRGNETVPESV